MSQFKLFSLLAILHPTTDSQFHQNTIVRCCTLWGAIHAVTFSGTVIGYPLGARGFFDLSCVIHCIHFCSVTFKLTTQPFVRDSWVCVIRDSMSLQIRRGGFYLALKPVSFGSENDADLGREIRAAVLSHPQLHVGVTYRDS